MVLEFGSVKLRVFFWVDFFLFLFFDFTSLLVDDRRFFLWSLWCYVKYSVCGSLADWITVKNVTSVLTVILAEAPSYGFDKQFSWDFLLCWLVLKERVNPSFDLQHSEILRLFSLFKFIKLNQFFVFFFKIVPGINFLFLLLFISLRWGKISFVVRQIRWSRIINVIVAVPLTAQFLFAFVSPCLLCGFVFSQDCFALFPFLLASFFYDFLYALLLSELFVVLLFLLFVPVLHICKDLLKMNVRHVVMLRKLGCEVRLARARLACDKGLKRLQASDLAKLFLNELDVL